VYAISSAGVTVTDLDTLEETSRVAIPHENRYAVTVDAVAEDEEPNDTKSVSSDDDGNDTEDTASETSGGGSTSNSESTESEATDEGANDETDASGN